MAGEKKVTLKEIAERTGVSLGTVHRVVHGKSGIGEETRKRVMEEIERSHYQIDEAASVLKRSAKRIAVVLPKVQGEERFYFRAIWRSIYEATEGMAQYKLYFEFIESEYPIAQFAEQLEKVYDEKVEEIDGLITIADNKEACAWVDRFAKRGVYVILISSNYESTQENNRMVECLRANHKVSGQVAAEFMSYGVQSYQGKILVVGDRRNVFSVNIYGESFLNAIRERCPGHAVEAYVSTDIESDKAELERQISNEKIAAIFSCSARMTYVICEILEKTGKGKELLMVGSDVFEELVPYFEDGIVNATVCQHHWEQGSRAVQRMYEYLSKGIRMEKDGWFPSILVMKSNYHCFLKENKEV